MKKNNKVIKLVILVGLFVMLFVNLNSYTFAAINSNYGVTNPVEEPDLNKKVENSIVLDSIGSFIYAVASMIEYIVGNIFEMLTGANMFPWADRVIFNSLPMLDVNFLNPSSGSLFVNSEYPGGTVIATMVRNTYFTILSLSIAFLGIVVGIMAIKLAISSIASEKAKYKEAITNWLFAIVLLFTIHYAISFIFFANEKMVEVASGVLTDQIEESGIAEKIVQTSTVEDDKLIVSNFIDAQQKIKWTDVLFGNVINNVGDIMSKFIDAVSDNTKNDYLKSDENVRIAAYLLRNSTYRSYRVLYADGNSGDRSLWESVKKALGDSIAFNNLGQRAIDYLYTDVKYVKESTNGDFSDPNGDEPGDYKGENAPIATALNSAYRTYVKKDPNADTGSSATSLISDLGQYFKNSAWKIETDKNGTKTGWAPNKVSLQGAIIYAIFVIQSLMFFFAYLKRFLYIIILSIMAPLVVIYDFFAKSLA